MSQEGIIVKQIFMQKAHSEAIVEKRVGSCT